MQSMRKPGLASRVLIMGILFLVGLSSFRCLPDLTAYRHWRVAQTKAFADGALMSVDDMWTLTVRPDHLRFLRVLCHGRNGFDPDKYWMKASLLQSPDGPVIQDSYTWYEPLPKTSYTPKGVTRFVWEFRIPAKIGNTFCVKISYQDSGLHQRALMTGNAAPSGEQEIDFVLPNVAIERDMSCPDIYAPGALWAVSSISSQN
jgi:hypothetical protein